MAGRGEDCCTWWSAGLSIRKLQGYGEALSQKMRCRLIEKGIHRHVCKYAQTSMNTHKKIHAHVHTYTPQIQNRIRIILYPSKTMK